MADSKLWEQAYKSYKKRPTKPKKQIQITTPRVEPMQLKHEYDKNSKQIKQLLKRNEFIRKKLKKMGEGVQMRSSYFERPIILYVLKLEGDNWYIGTSRDVERRFKKHVKGSGAQWTKKHAPIEIVQSIDTKTTEESKACKLEDDLTIEYAIKYCAQKVRGGGYSQTKVKPNWPKEVLESEEMCSHL